MGNYKLFLQISIGLFFLMIILFGYRDDYMRNPKQFLKTIAFVGAGMAVVIFVMKVFIL